MNWETSLGDPERAAFSLIQQVGQVRLTWAPQGVHCAEHLRALQGLCTLQSFQFRKLLLTTGNTLPWGSSVISSGATWPRRSLVAWTLDWKPFANLLADWPRLRLPMLDWRVFHPSMLTVVVNLWWKRKSKRVYGSLLRIVHRFSTPANTQSFSLKHAPASRKLSSWMIWKILTNAICWVLANSPLNYSVRDRNLTTV